MITNQLKKKVKSLHQLKFRQKYNNFIAEGPKICDEYLKQSKYTIDHIFCNENWYYSNKALIEPDSGKTIICKDKELDSISLLKHANKILIVCHIPENINPEDVNSEDKNWALYLDNIRDPGNMGTMIRIADWYGIKYLISSPECVDYYNPKVVQASMGSHNRVEFLSCEFESIKNRFRNIIALALGGDPLNSVNLKESNLIVVGNESRGIRKSIIDKSNFIMTLPGKGGAESLNASVACGIACHQLLFS